MRGFASNRPPRAGRRPPLPPSVCWGMALAGLAVTVFSVLVLSGPGRIDIVDGQTRYEVARSLVDHADVRIRDPRVWFGVLPGRGGHRYTTYRLPHSLLGVVAVWVADLTGPAAEGRRHFFFVLTSAFAATCLALAYAAWFRRLGRRPGAALGWAAAGVFCTPAWFYATSTFDDILGALFAVAAFVLVFAQRRGSILWPALLAGLALALAFHSKPPLAILVLPLLAAVTDPARDARRQSLARVVILATLLVGLLSQLGYEHYKFPPVSRQDHGALQQIYVPIWPGNLAAGLAGLTVSPGKGIFWYCPAFVLGLAGLVRWWPRERWLVAVTAGALLVLLGFLSSLVIFSGDPAWGPRYLLPVVAVLWLWAPDGMRRLGGRLTALLLVVGALIQVASLAVDPHRLYVEHSLPSVFYAQRPWAYFDPSLAHLVQRPREIWEIAHRPQSVRSSYFSPAPSPTFAFPVLDFMEQGPRAVAKYHVLSSFRPWWASQRYLRPRQRPVDLKRWLRGSGVTAAAGLLLLTGSLWGLGRGSSGGLGLGTAAQGLGDPG